MSRTVLPGLVLGGEPHAQLLPPSVKLREKARSTRRLMAMVVVLAVVVAGAGTFGAYWFAYQAETELAASQARTIEILAEQSKYAEGAELAAQVEATETAQRIVTANEIDWLELAGAVLGYVPCDCITVEIGLTSPAPWEPPLIPEGPLRAARIASMTLTLSATDYFSAATFVGSVRELEGLDDAFITGTKFEDGQYKTMVVLTFDSEVLARRYVVDEPGSTGAAPGGSEETTDAGATPAPGATPGAVPEPDSTEGTAP